MRIISGKYKGKKIEGYGVLGTRPTMDRVKESLFATIQNHIHESICLDLFAGSGNLGLEALSNGASYCYFVDHNKEIIKFLRQNINNLGIKNSHVLNMDYMNALDYFREKKITFDLIFLDPPYKLNLINSCLEYIEKHHLLKENGLIICEYENEKIHDIYTTIKEKKYGDKFVKIIAKQ